MLSPEAEEDLWIRRFHPLPESVPRLVCFPHAGGSASYYFTLSQSLTPRAEVLAVQYPGRQDRRHEPMMDSITELADRIFHALHRWTDRPFAFFGHSMGAVLAFEVAQRFHRVEQVDPRFLIVSARRAPSRLRPGNLHLRDDDGLISELRRVGGTEEMFLNDAELRPAVLRLIRNDYKAIEGYAWSPTPSIDCPITALVGDSDPYTSVDDAAAWAQHSSGAFDLRVFPGGHFYLDNHRMEVIELISAALSAVPRSRQE